MTETATRSVVIEREIPHPPEKIWRALTEGTLIEEWLMKNDFKPVLGHRSTLRMTPQPDMEIVVDCEVLAVEPNKTLSYTWDSFDLKSVVTWSLTPTGAGTLLRMEQSGFLPDQQQYYQGAKYGWKGFIDSLERVVAGLN